MSLRVFHVVFVVVSVLLALLVARWSLETGRAGAGSGYYLMAAGSTVAAAGLGAYGTWFLRKTEGMSLW